MTGVLDHTMIRIEDLDETLSWYQNHFDWEEKDRWEADTFTNVYIGPEDMHEEGAMLELTYNHGDHTYEMGDAWGHIAVRVDDVYDAYEQLLDEGVKDYRDPDSCGGQYAFVTDPDGHEIELVERDYGVQWSLDHTMIRVEDVDAAIGWYTRKLDYDMVRRSEHNSFALYFMKPADAAEEAMSVELTYNYDGRNYEMGDAWGHICLRSDDLQGDWDKLMERDAPDYRDPEACDNLFAFTKDADGHELELLDRDPDSESLFPT